MQHLYLARNDLLFRQTDEEDEDGYPIWEHDLQGTQALAEAWRQNPPTALKHLDLTNNRLGQRQTGTGPWGDPIWENDPQGLQALADLPLAGC